MAQKYLFLLLDRYEASFSESFQIRSSLKPKLLFRNCVIQYAGCKEEAYEDEVGGEVCCRGNFCTWDGERYSYLLIKLEV